MVSFFKIQTKVHIVEEAFVCEICDKDFTQSCSLKTYIRHNFHVEFPACHVLHHFNLRFLYL